MDIYVMLFILFFLLIYFALNSGFSFLLTVLFNNLTTFFWRNTLLHVIKAKNKIFVFYHRKFLLSNTFGTKIFKWSAENRFIKKLRVCIFLRTHWRLSMILKTSKNVYECFLICKSMYILKVYSIHTLYTLR